MLGGRMEWVGMSRGRFVGGRNVKVPKFPPGIKLPLSFLHLGNL